MSDMIGRVIPEFELPISTGGTFNTSEDLKGRWTILYFYPKDDTPGCTVQACSYRDAYDEFASTNAQVIGVSADDLDSHEQFINKFSLNFPLLADVDKKLSLFLNVYGDQEWQGKVYKGISRDTFLIDPSAKVRKVWRKVDPRTTVEETKKALAELQESK